MAPNLCFAPRAMCKHGEERPKRSCSVRIAKCSVKRVCTVVRRETFGGEGTDEPSREAGQGTRWQCCYPARSLARLGSLVLFLLLALSVALALTCPLSCCRKHLTIVHGFQAAISLIRLLTLLQPPAFAHLHDATSGNRFCPIQDVAPQALFIVDFSSTHLLLLLAVFPALLKIRLSIVS
jgi:hypothetical protein